jgi:hypothetical protein
MIEPHKDIGHIDKHIGLYVKPYVSMFYAVQFAPGVCYAIRELLQRTSIGFCGGSISS